MVSEPRDREGGEHLASDLWEITDEDSAEIMRRYAPDSGNAPIIPLLAALRTLRDRLRARVEAHYCARVQPQQEPEGESKAAYFEGWRHGLNAVVDIDPDTGPIADTTPKDSWPRSNARARLSQPQQEPEWDRWTGDMIHQLEVDYWKTQPPRPVLWDYMAERINEARVQPRTVSREKLIEVLEDWEMDDYQEDGVAERLGLQIAGDTPTEEQEE